MRVRALMSLLLLAAAGRDPGQLVQAETKPPDLRFAWCVNRVQQDYTELLCFEVCGTPSSSAASSRRTVFRGALAPTPKTVVNCKGRRAFCFLPREDARLFSRLAEEPELE